ncbi:nucleotidyltransferase domain-containing protein [Paenibacillus sonchi]|nr:nucleotidyltransferase domain-containing protein [Paenibacillus sonchi]
MQVEPILDRFTAIFREELEADLAGIYLHGSLAMGCFNPVGSDIDILVVIRTPLPHARAARIAQKLLALRDDIANGLEILIYRSIRTLRSGMKVYFCCIFQFKDGLIYRQRRFDCFERFQ